MGHPTRTCLALGGAVLLILLQAAPASAYVGPGPGMEFFGYAMSLLAMAGIALMSFLSWPIVTLLRWLRGSSRQEAQAPSIDLPPAAESRVG